MANDQTVISAQVRKGNVAVVSRHPLAGILKLSSAGATVELALDRKSAEGLISALALFLLQDDDGIRFDG